MINCTTVTKRYPEGPEALKDVSFDPGRNYSMTWQSGFAGIGYDKSKVGKELKTLEDLWTTP